MQDFWSSERLHSGDPKGWSDAELRAWLSASDEGFTSGMGWNWNAAPSSAWSGKSRADLVKTTTRQLDKLYSEFKPDFQIPLDGIDVSRLPPWSPFVGRCLGMHGGNATCNVRCSLR